jgi:predicted DNA-binding WGR domain protein/Leucine-rich repeat (LRR) protein
MKFYLEYKDDKSAKFWQIECIDNTHTVTYGKIGTKGQEKTKTFDTAEKAQKEAEKMIKAKKKKGYEEVITTNASEDENTTIQTVLLSKEEAYKQYPIKNSIVGNIDYDAHIVVKGDVVINEDFGDHNVERFFFPNGRETVQEMIIIEGDLTVQGDFTLCADPYYPCLLVLGNLYCDVFDHTNNYVHITGDAFIKYVFSGDYNHGSIDIDGTTYVPYLINSDHGCGMTPHNDTICINCYSDHDDFFNYDYYHEDLISLMDESILDIYDEEEHDLEFDANRFIELVKAGKSPFKKGAKVKKAMSVATIEKFAQEQKEKPSAPEKKATTENPKAIIMTEEEAIEAFDLGKYDPLGDVGYDSIFVLEGDVFVNGNLDEDSLADLLELENEDDYEEGCLYIFKGNLSVKGDVDIPEDCPCLLVLGDLYCEVLHSFDNVIQVNGDAYIKYAFNGNYNHGSITIEGTAHVPYILNSDHDSRLNPSKDTVCINYYSDWDDFFTYDYYSEDLPEICLKKALSSDGEFQYDQFIALLKAGKSPIKKGAKPGRVRVKEMIEKLAKKATDGEGIKKLDLTDKKLQTIPAAIFELESLEELILESNSFTVIPPEISKLKNLKVLNLKKTNIESLTYAIGRLENLEELNLSYCQKLKKLPPAIGGLKSLKKLTLWSYQGDIPKEITQLTNLEYLDFYGIYGYGVKPVEFPEWITQLKGLKWLSISNNSLKNIPDSLLNLSQLETLKMNSALCYVQTLPDLTQLKHLKHLECDGRVTLTTRPPVPQEMIQTFFKIKTLESLKIDAYGLEDQYMPMGTVNKHRETYQNQPEKLKEFESRLRLNSSGNYFYQRRRPMKLEDLKGLANLVNLKYLDIAWNKLEKLPVEVLELKKLEKIKLYGNEIPEEDINKLKKLNPAIIIE